VYHPRNVGYTRALQYITETDLETCISGPSTLIWFIRWCQFHPANLQNESEHRGKTMDIADDDATNPNTALLCSVTYVNAPNGMSELCPTSAWHNMKRACDGIIEPPPLYSCVHLCAAGDVAWRARGGTLLYLAFQENSH
jgi:hypothetical protein